MSSSVLHGPAALAARLIGSTQAFIAGLVLVGALVAAGLWLGFSDHWLAVFSAALSAVTFLLVFLLQYRENRDTAAIQIKLNELLRAVEGAQEKELLDLEHLAEDEQQNISDKLHRSIRDARADG